jgi:integrase
MSVTLKNGIWYAVLSLKDNYGNRTQPWRPLGREDEMDEKAAIRAEGKLIGKIEAGVESASKRIKLEKYFGRWLELEVIPIRRPNTVYNQKSRVKAICKNLGQIYLQKLTSEQIQQHLTDELKRGLKPSSIKLQFQTLNNAMNSAVKWGYIPKNICEHVILPTVEGYTHKAFEDKQAQKIINASKDAKLFIPCLLGLLCGLRRAEICGLRWMDVDLDNRTATIVHNYQRDPIKKTNSLQPVKTDKSCAEIPLPVIVVQALLEEKKGRVVVGINQGEQHVWAQEDGRPYTPQQLYRRFKGLLKRLGIEGRPHDMRHTFATLLYDAGMDDKAVSTAIRHTRTGFTSDFYIHMRQKAKEKPAKVMDKKFGNLLGKC